MHPTKIINHLGVQTKYNFMTKIPLLIYEYYISLLFYGCNSRKLNTLKTKQLDK
jgi:hypothetical protein